MLAVISWLPHSLVVLPQVEYKTFEVLHPSTLCWKVKEVFCERLAPCKDGQFLEYFRMFVVV